MENGLRDQMLRIGCDLMREGGLRSLTMRSTAAAASTRLRAVQFHFGNHDRFVRDVIRFWADEVTKSLLEAAGEARGLARAARLSRAWLSLPDTHLIPMEATRTEASRPGHDGPRGMFLGVLEEWIGMTHRSLEQARAKGQLNPGMELRTLALEIHRHWWGHGWTSALYGVDGSARIILEAIWHRLAGIAVNPSEVLPPLAEFLGSAGREAASAMTAHRWNQSKTKESWQMFLTPADPLFHAFERHRLMGDERTFLDPPPVISEDEGAARTFSARFTSDVSSGRDRATVTRPILELQLCVTPAVMQHDEEPAESAQ